MHPRVRRHQTLNPSMPRRARAACADVRPAPSDALPPDPLWGVFELDPERVKLCAEGVGAGILFRLASGLAFGDQCFHLSVQRDRAVGLLAELEGEESVHLE